MTARINPYANMKLVQPFIDFARASPPIPAGTRLGRVGEDSCLPDQRLRHPARITHATEARRKGETEERVSHADAWRERPRSTACANAPRLGWTEALTRLAPETGVSDDGLQGQRWKANFSRRRNRRNLTLMIGVINSFNRIGVGYRLGHPVDFSRQPRRRPDGEGEDRVRRRHGFRSLAPAAGPHRLPDARVSRGRGGRGAGACLRWHAGPTAMRCVVPEAFLAAHRDAGCALDVLKPARRRRETYIGPLAARSVLKPEERRHRRRHPSADAGAGAAVAAGARRVSSCTMCLGSPLKKIAETIGRDPAACRQLSSRARDACGARRGQTFRRAERTRTLRSRRLSSSPRASGDLQKLRSLLAGDVIAAFDGGGKVPAALAGFWTGAGGCDEGCIPALARLFAGQMPVADASPWPDQWPAGICHPGDPMAKSRPPPCRSRTAAIAAIYVMRNPDQAAPSGRGCKTSERPGEKKKKKKQNKNKNKKKKKK